MSIHLLFCPMKFTSPAIMRIIKTQSRQIEPVVTVYASKSVYWWRGHWSIEKNRLGGSGIIKFESHGLI